MKKCYNEDVQQHPVPQQIASYEFRLVGDMTLKQFGWLASGAIVGLLIYSLPIIPLIKWGLISTAGFLGFAFAFLPIEERPLSTWLVAFFQAIFSPTLFIWKKSGVIHEFFNYQPQASGNLSTSLPSVDKGQLEAYLRTLPEAKPQSSKVTEPQSLEIPELQPKPVEIYPPKEARNEFKKKKKETPKVNVIKTDSALPLVAQPSKPNLLAGIVLGPNDEMVAGAILEIKNRQGISVRALKTNKLGQFKIATPMENGAYQIEVEKEGLNFAIIKIEVKGEIIAKFKPSFST